VFGASDISDLIDTGLYQQVLTDGNTHGVIFPGPGKSVNLTLLALATSAVNAQVHNSLGKFNSIITVTYVIAVPCRSRPCCFVQFPVKM